MKDSHPLQGLHLHLDPTSGIAGDMTVAALVDAGVPGKVVTDAVARMRIPGLTLKFERRARGAYVRRGVVVALAGGRRGQKKKAPPDYEDPPHPGDNPHHRPRARPRHPLPL